MNIYCRFGYGSPTTNFDPVELRQTVFPQTIESRLDGCGLKFFLDTIQFSTQTSLSDIFMLDVVHSSWWNTDISIETVALTLQTNTLQILVVLTTDTLVRYAPRICTLSASDMPYINLCAWIFYVQLCYYSANSPFTQCSYIWNAKSVKIGHQAVHI